MRLMTTMAMGLMLGACGPDEVGDAGYGPGTCTSTTTEVDGGGYTTDIEVTYRADGQESFRVEEIRDGYGMWQATVWREVGFVGDQVASVVTEVDSVTPLLFGFESQRETFVYDEEGWLVQEDHQQDGVMSKTYDYDYDDAGHKVASLLTVHTDRSWDQATAFTWVEGRLERVETHLVDGGEPSYVETRDYLAPAPSLDAQVRTETLGWAGDERIERYEGEQLVAREHTDGGMAGALEAWGYRDDGQLDWSLWSAPDQEPMLRVYHYDDDGHLVLAQRGPDTDGDGVQDAVDEEQTWHWDCR